MKKITRVMSEDRVRQIFELKKKGYTYRQIVKEMKTSDVSVAKYLDMGLEKSVEYVRTIKEQMKEGLPKLSSGEIESDERAKLWLDSMDKGSIYNYKTGIGYFCSMVGEKPSELIEEAISEIKAGKLLNERNYFTYLQQFEKVLKEEGYASTSRNSYLTAVRSFYGFYEIEMPKKKGGRKAKKVKPLKENHKVHIAKEDLRKMLDVTKYLRDKALILAVASSGLGRSELQLLDVKDFVNGYDEETGICVLSEVLRVKTDKDFISFFSTECSDMIWNYLQSERGITKEEAKNHLSEPLFTAIKNTWRGSKGLISRLGLKTIDQVFRNIAIRVDVQNAPRETENGNVVFNKFHPHNLRKFFNTQMKLIGCPEIAVEHMMGHSIESTKDTYFIENPGELKQLYLKAMPAVTLEKTETKTIVSDEYKEIQMQNEALRAEIEEIKAKQTTNKIEIESITKSDFGRAMFEFFDTPEGEELMKKMSKKFGEKAEKEFDEIVGEPVPQKREEWKKEKEK